MRKLRESRLDAAHLTILSAAAREMPDHGFSRCYHFPFSTKCAKHSSLQLVPLTPRRRDDVDSLNDAYNLTTRLMTTRARVISTPARRDVAKSATRTPAIDGSFFQNSLHVSCLYTSACAHIHEFHRAAAEIGLQRRGGRRQPAQGFISHAAAGRRHLACHYLRAMHNNATADITSRQQREAPEKLVGRAQVCYARLIYDKWMGRHAPARRFAVARDGSMHDIYGFIIAQRN